MISNKLQQLILIGLLLIGANAIGQERDTIKVMSYNLLNFPSTNPGRIDTLKEILQFVKPDIFMVCELTNGAGADDILFNALNEDGVSHYDMADYVDGPDTQNELYFNSNKLGLKEQNEIETELRDINEYVLYYKTVDIETTADTTFFYVYVCHLKASSGFEAQRNSEVESFKAYLDARTEAENIIFGGDFNFYGSEIEPAWNTVLTSGSVQLFDPINAPGNWHNNSDFAWLHTQSTRTSDIDGGAYGGMDDRFDLIFIGEDLKLNENGANYIEGSYTALGQDGMHFNQSLIDLPVNLSLPPEIIHKLYYMSDHLPVIMEIAVYKESLGVNSQMESLLDAFYDAQQDEIRFKESNLAENSQVEFQIYSMTGQMVDSVQMTGYLIPISTKGLLPGSYVLKMVGKPYSYTFVKP